MPKFDHEADRQHGAVEAVNNVSSPPTWTIGDPIISIDAPAPTIDTIEDAELSVDIRQEPRRLSNNSDLSILLSTRPSHNRQHVRRPPLSEDFLVVPGSSRHEPISFNIPYGLRPTEHDTHHAPHPLNGPRHTSRCGIAENDAFALHCSQYGQWIIDRAFNTHTTIKIGHGSGSSFRCFEAKFLGFPGVTAIKIVHPLCAVQLRSLDWDVVRAVALHLRQYVGKRAVITSNRNEAIQKAEEMSLRVVEFELESRSWERQKAANHSSDDDASNAADELPKYDGPHSPLSYENRSFLSVTSMAPLMAIPPERTRRPEHNTRRSNHTRMAEEESYTVKLKKHTEDTLDQSHPDGNSYPPGTKTHAAYDSDGIHIGQYPAHKQTSRFLRSSRRRPRVEQHINDALGVNYGCTGRDEWH